MVETWSFSETIHSRSYTHIILAWWTIRALFLTVLLRMKKSQPSDQYLCWIWQALWDDLRAQSLGEKEFERLYVNEYGWEHTLCIVSFSARWCPLMRLRRPFLCKFCMYVCLWRTEVAWGNTKIMRFIARDEALHCEGTDAWSASCVPVAKVYCGKRLLWWRKRHLRHHEISRRTRNELADYLFKDGSMIGLNADILKTM